MTSLAFSLSMYTALTMKKPGMRGKTDASTTLSLVVPCAKVAVHHGHLVPFQSHLAGTGRVVTPGLVPGELPYLLPGTDALSRHRLLLDNFTRAAQNAPYELYAFYQGLQVISARVAAFIEVIELDVSRRRLPRAAPSALPSPDCRRARRRLHRSPR
jgi:hypothetical protein